MWSFFLFIYQYKVFLVFIILQFFSILLIVKNSNYNRATFLNSTNLLFGVLLEKSSEIYDFINLTRTNEDLRLENKTLRTKYYALMNYHEDDNFIDTTNNFSFISTKIIKNSVHLLNNTITINSGYNQGIKPNMGVIGNQGIVGKVKRVSKNYATIVSLLDIDVQVSAEIKDKIKLCTVQWDGRSPRYAKILYVPRHYNLTLGDTIVTSGNNAIYPQGILIGTISKLYLPKEAIFYDIDIELINDFTNLSFVEIILNKNVSEIDSLLVKNE